MLNIKRRSSLDPGGTLQPTIRVVENRKEFQKKMLFRQLPFKGCHQTVNI